MGKKATLVLGMLCEPVIVNSAPSSSGVLWGLSRECSAHQGVEELLVGGGGVGGHGVKVDWPFEIGSAPGLRLLPLLPQSL